MIRVLFICMGNICRSPMAEAVFMDRVRQAGLEDKISADSAGTGGWHAGEQAHPGTLNILRRHGIAYDGRARQIQQRDLDEFDYVLAMDRDNLSALRRMRQGRAEVRLFLEEARKAGTVQTDEVPDPYYDGTFDRAYRLVTAGVDAFLDYLRRRHQM